MDSSTGITQFNNQNSYAYNYSNNVPSIRIFNNI